MTEFRIVEIFESLQGEGYNTGMPAIFIRFAGCNLDCPWCDTDFRHYQRMSFEQIVHQVTSYQSKNIIITGGEPTLQTKLPELLTYLKNKGYFIAIESNGLRSVYPEIDYIALSPKFYYRQRYHTLQQPTADEIRIVVEDHPDMLDFCLEMEQRIKASRYYLSPCEQEGQMNLLSTLRLLGQLNQARQNNKWQLSLQTHKLAGIE